MTEYMDKWAEEITSEFIVVTCQLLPKSCEAISNSRDIEVANIIVCGSMAEFYIRPVNTCIADVDVLCFKANELAFIDDLPVLPRDVSSLSDTVGCYKIESDLRYPGFVRLRILGKMYYNWKHKSYDFSSSTVTNRYARFDIDADAQHLTNWSEGGPNAWVSNTVRGPAITVQDSAANVSRDTVKSMWCPQWPIEAQSWPKRSRDHGWPTIATISEVVQQGCHVVYVQHRACRSDDEQWRLSFSVAEVILTRSWTKIQQIVYHLLRFFSKRELIQKDCIKEDEVLCTYHLKTLMLWACEEMSPQWWNSSSVVAIFCELLKKLSEWLKRIYCPNYFVPEANLFYEKWNPKMLHKTERRLNEFGNSGILCHWLIENYVLPFTGKHFAVISTRKVKLHFMDCMLPLFKFREAMQSVSMDFLFFAGFMSVHNYARALFNVETVLAPGSCLSNSLLRRKVDILRLSITSILPIPENDWCLTFLDTTLFSLYAARFLRNGNMSWESRLFVEYIKGIFLKPKIVRCQYHIFPKPFSAERSQFQLLQVQYLMENLTGSNSRSEFKILSLLSTELLRKAIQCDYFQSNDIASAALVYLAALHYATSENQIALDLCSAVMMDQTTHMRHETLNAGCLFFIDDFASIVGFCLMCKKFSENMHFCKRQIYVDLRVTPKVFAHFLRVLSAERITKQLDISSALPISEFLFDHVLLVLAKRKSSTSIKSGICFEATKHCVYRRTDPLTATSISSVNSSLVKQNLIDALVEYALENKTVFYDLIHKEWGIQCNTIDCYRALYLYKCRQYDKAMDLCERILHEMDMQSDLKEYGFANVLVLPPLDSLFDGDVQSLLGFHTLFCYFSPLIDGMEKFELTAESKFPHWFAHNVYFYRNELSIIRKYHSSIKRHYSLGRHFLARYLKLRCCVDCNHPFTKTMAEFAAMKCSRPFEHVIRRFLLQKLRNII